MLLDDEATQANLLKEWSRPAQPVEQSFSAWSFAKSGLKGPVVGLGYETPAAMLDALSLFATPYAASYGQGDGAEAARQNMLKGNSFDPSMGNELRAKADEFAPDPATANTADKAIFGVTRGVSKAVGYMSLLGGVPGAIGFGLDEGETTAQGLIAKGIDPKTAYKVGGITGATSTVGAMLPIGGNTMLQTAGLTLLSGPALFMAQEQMAKSVLQNANYKAEGDLHNPLDPLGLALSMAIPTAIGGLHMRGVAKRASAVEAGGIPLTQMTLSERQGLKYDAAPLDAFTEQAAQAHGVPPDILLAIKNAGEKSGSKAVSPKGAQGVMQFMPATAKEMGIKDPTDPIESINGAAAYMAKLHEAYGSWDAAVAHYNGGGSEAALVRSGAKPSKPETAAYLERVQKFVAERQATRGGADSEVVDAARVKVQEAVLSETLPDHPAARHEVMRAIDAIGAGERVTAPEFPPELLPMDGFKRRLADHMEGLQSERSELLATSSGMLEPGTVKGLRSELEAAQAKAPDSSDAGIRQLAKQIQASEEVSYKAALSSAKKQTAQLVDDHAATVRRLSDQLDTHAKAQQAFDQISGIDREIGDVSKRMSALPGPATAPTRLSQAILEGFDSSGAPVKLGALEAPRQAQQAPETSRLPSPDQVSAEAEKAAPKPASTQPKAAQGEQASALPSLDSMRLDQVAKESPDMKVILPGHDAPMSLADAMESAQAQAKLDASEAELFKAAMLCALENGAVA